MSHRSLGAKLEPCIRIESKPKKALIVIKFCSRCGARVSFRIPPDDTLPRHVCDACGEIHYLNPKVIVGAIAEWEDQILLCRRAIEPRHGKWTLPAGFMENCETTAAGAARETAEEACARLEEAALFALIDVTHISQVHVFYRAALADLDFRPGKESLETRLFREHEIPWNELAFRSVTQCLRYYYADRQSGHFSVHVGAITTAPVSE